MKTAINRGFTLIEMLVVTAIIILLAAFLVPAVMGSQESYDEMAASDLVGGLLIALNIQKLESKGLGLDLGQASQNVTRATSLQIWVWLCVIPRCDRFDLSRDLQVYVERTLECGSVNHKYNTLYSGCLGKPTYVYLISS